MSDQERAFRVRKGIGARQVTPVTQAQLARVETLAQAAQAAQQVQATP
jgi:hypothetical protein